MNPQISTCPRSRDYRSSHFNLAHPARRAAIWTVDRCPLPLWMETRSPWDGPFRPIRKFLLLFGSTVQSKLNTQCGWPRRRERY